MVLKSQSLGMVALHLLDFPGLLPLEPTTLPESQVFQSLQFQFVRVDLSFLESVIIK
jgi:hypothetical protein